MTGETATQSELRGMLGETIPVDGTAADTLIPDEKLLDTWLKGSGDDLNKAALSGWRWKMAHWAGLVNVTDGAASRNFSDLMAHAETMINMYTKLSRGAAQGRSRVGRIERL